MSEQLKKINPSGYLVIFGYIKQDYLTPEIEDLIAKYRKYLFKNKTGVIERLEELVQKYPQVPVFKNFLSIAYIQNGFREKFEYIVFKTIEDHPDYSFGKFQMINYYVEKDDMAKLDEIFENVNDIIDFYPDKNTFHISEIIAFHEGYLSYLTKKKDFDKVAERLKNLKILVSRDRDELDKINVLEKQLDAIRLRSSIEFFEKMAKKKRPDISFKDFYGQTKIKPVFQYKEIESFYTASIEINPLETNQILALPHDSLVEDLETIIEDVQKRFVYFRDVHENDFFTMHFHAIFFLAELKSEKSLDKIFNLFRQNDEFYDFWFGDWMDIMLIPLYQLTQNNLTFLSNYLKEEDNVFAFRHLASEIVSQVALHQPERREEVLVWYRELFAYFLENKDNEKLIDSSLIGNMCGDILEFQGKELLDIIKELFDASIADDFFAGDFDTIKIELDNPTYTTYNSMKKQVDLNIYQIYTKLSNQESLDMPDTEEDIRKRQEEMGKINFSPFFSKETSDKLFGAGLDVDEDGDEYNEEDVLYLSKKESQILRPKFNYSRNDKVTVQYQDGKILKDVKFKKVEDDLIQEKCKILD